MKTKTAPANGHHKRRNHPPLRQNPINRMEFAMNFVGMDKFRQMADQTEAKRKAEQKAHSDKLAKDLADLAKSREQRHATALDLIGVGKN